MRPFNPKDYDWDTTRKWALSMGGKFRAIAQDEKLWEITLARHLTLRRMDNDHWGLRHLGIHCDCFETVIKLYLDRDENGATLESL